jgi:hypothetical protein
VTRKHALIEAPICCATLTLFSVGGSARGTAAPAGPCRGGRAAGVPREQERRGGCKGGVRVPRRRDAAAVGAPGGVAGVPQPCVKAIGSAGGRALLSGRYIPLRGGGIGCQPASVSSPASPVYQNGV